MNIVNKLTLRHLKENKGRTVVTTMGIIVSVAMITAVLVAMTSFFSLFGDITAYTDGNYIFRISDATQQEIESVKNDSRVSGLTSVLVQTAAATELRSEKAMQKA